MGIPLFFRCEGVKFQSLKAVSVTLKENYSIPERCLGMRDMLKKFRGEGAAPGTFGLWFPPYLGNREVFPENFVELLPVYALMSSGWFHLGRSLLSSWMDCEVTLKPRMSLGGFNRRVAHDLLLSVLGISEAVELSSF